jgi:hypothetical protein
MAWALQKEVAKAQFGPLQGEEIMNRSVSFALAAVSVVSLVASSAAAEPAAGVRDVDAPEKQPAAFQLSLWSSAQIVDRNRAIHGFKLNLPYGENRDMDGFDFGIASNTKGHMNGLQLGLGGYIDGKVQGVQHNFFVSMANGPVTGWQTAVYASAGGDLRGAQTGFVNYAWSGLDGVQFGAVNIARGSARGAAVGVVNYARRTEGVQIGLVNVTGELRGIQIGVANVAPNGLLPVMPIMNAAL